jgi:hypothetical protein
VFPTDELGNAISNEKIGPAIYESPNIKRKLAGAGMVHRYRFRNGSIYGISGALKKSGGRAASRDYVIFDEMEWMPESIFGVYERVMEHSPLRMVRKVSTPTVPLVGIDKAVKQGCEYVWHWKCRKCKKEQIFTWPDNLINYFEVSDYEPDDPKYLKKLNTTYIGCKYCGQYLDRNSAQYVKQSRWIAKKPGLEGIRSSYYVNGMMIAWKTGKEILRKFHGLSAYTFQFFNEIIGEAYLSGDHRIAEVELLKCQRPWTMPVNKAFTMRNISMGIDWGVNQSWAIISANGFDAQDKEIRCVVHVAEINDESLKKFGVHNHISPHVEYAAKLMEIFGCDICVNDANGIGADRHAQLVKRFPGRVYGAFFDTAEQGRQLRQSKMLMPQWNESSYRVTFSKVALVKAILGEVRKGDVGLPQMTGEHAEVIRKYIRHHQALAVQSRWEETWQREFEIVVKMHSQDHLYDADMYSRVGFDKLVGFRSQTPGVILKR